MLVGHAKDVAIIDNREREKKNSAVLNRDVDLILASPAIKAAYLGREF